jgi:hypothetical protein
MILKIEKPLPEYVVKQIEKLEFDKSCIRRCPVYIAEEDAATYIHPESFDFSDVFGQCEIIQLKGYPPVVSKFEFEKNQRSFEAEAAANIEQYGAEKYMQEEYGVRWSEKDRAWETIKPTVDVGVEELASLSEEELESAYIEAMEIIKKRREQQ